MRYEDRYILELSRAAAFDDIPFVPAENVIWEYIYNKSVEQNITGLLFTAVTKLSDEYCPDKSLLEQWRSKMIETIAVSGRQFNEFLKMSKAFCAAEIKVVGLKGCIIRDLYPVPELRTMGDFDILIDNENLEAIKNLFQANDYACEKDIYGIVAKNEKAFWEIFVSLNEEFGIEPEKYTKILYDAAENVGNIWVLPKNWFLAHLIIHTGKHFIEKGAGIRNLFDIVLFINKYINEISFKEVRKICEAQNYSRIFDYIMSTAEVYFNLNISSDAFEKLPCEEFVEYMLSYGVHGKMDNVLVHQYAKYTDDSIKGWRKLFFPSVKTLEYRYVYLKKCRFLLPVAWIHRFFSGIFSRGFRVGDMIKDYGAANEFAEKRLSVLEKLDLIDRR